MENMAQPLEELEHAGRVTPGGKRAREQDDDQEVGKLHSRQTGNHAQHQIWGDGHEHEDRKDQFIMAPLVQPVFIFVHSFRCGKP